MVSSPYDLKNMKCGQVAGNRHINAFIYLCFGHIFEEDQRKFVKKFREQPHGSDQIMHTFRELILGAYLSSNGFRVRHDYAVIAKTPDWCILDDKSEVTGIVELTNFHLDKVTESEIKKQMEAKVITVFWRDQNKDNVDRLYHCIWHKADAYHALIKKLKKPYVISIFGEFQAAVDFEEVEFCLFDKDIGLFERYPEISGVLYFEESSGRYSFNYARNPYALEVLNLPSGVFPAEAFYRDREEPHSSPLPHHAAYGSVLRGSADQAESDPGEQRPNEQGMLHAYRAPHVVPLKD
jgi:hypothetical protein